MLICGVKMVVSGEGAMPLNQVFARFVEDAPLSVMVQGALENIFHPDAINKLFERTAQTQYTRDLLFSTVMDTMTLVACGIYKTPHAVYQDNPDWFPVSVTSLYNKLHGIETVVSAELVRDSSARISDIIRALGGELPLCSPVMWSRSSTAMPWPPPSTASKRRATRAQRLCRASRWWSSTRN